MHCVVWKLNMKDILSVGLLASEPSFLQPLALQAAPPMSTVDVTACPMIHEKGGREFSEVQEPSASEADAKRRRFEPLNWHQSEMSHIARLTNTSLERTIYEIRPGSPGWTQFDEAMTKEPSQVLCGSTTQSGGITDPACAIVADEVAPRLENCSRCA